MVARRERARQRNLNGHFPVLRLRRAGAPRVRSLKVLIDPNAEPTKCSHAQSTLKNRFVEVESAAKQGRRTHLGVGPQVERPIVANPWRGSVLGQISHLGLIQQ